MRTACALLLARAAAAQFDVSPMIAVGDDPAGGVQLFRVDYSQADPFTQLGAPLQNMELVQGDATAYDGNGTLYAVLNPVVGGRPDFSRSSLIAFDTSGAVQWQHDFTDNYTMGALAWEPTLGLVGLCGTLLTDLKVSAYCGVDKGSRSPRIIYDFNNSLMYDADTRALDPVRHRYYHRLYNATWMPDYFVTLDSTTGALLNSVQFFSPEFSGTRVNVRTGGLWSICNAPNGLDLCGVDPATGAFAPTGAFDQLRQSDFLYAATAAIDAARSFYLLVAEFASDGTFTRVVDIDAGSPTFGRIVANLSVHTGAWLSNFHALGGPDGGTVAAAAAAGTPLGCTTAPFTSYPFCDATLDTAARVADAVSRMTLQEKIDSMTRPFGSPFVDCHGTSRIASLGVDGLPNYSECLHGVAAGCIDIGGGEKRCPTLFPNAPMLGASFNRTLFRAVGSTIGDEMRALNNIQGAPSGFSCWSPNLNLARDSRWGRAQEVPGEE